MARQVVTSQFNAKLLVEDLRVEVTLNPQPGDLILDGAGDELGTVADLVNATMQANSPNLNRDLGQLRDGTSAGEAVTDFGYGFFVASGDGRLLPVKRITYQLQAVVTSEPIALKPRGLAGVIFSSGTARFGDDEALLVMTEKDGHTRVTIRGRTARGATDKRSQ